MEVHKAELARLVKRRDAIHSQLAQLSDLVNGFMDDEPSEEPAAPKAPKTEPAQDATEEAAAESVEDETADA